MSTISAAELIRIAKEKPPEPIIDGLLYARDIMLIHGTEECFKSVFVLQMAESLAAPVPLLRSWDVPQVRRVGIIETEMHASQIGTRLDKMFPGGNAPEAIGFLNEDKLRDFRGESLEGKFSIIQNWVSEQNFEVLMIDTANDFFRGDDNPSAEQDVGEFFDRLRDLRLPASILVRHDRKRRPDDGFSDNSNERIRGSAEWKEDPEVILHLKRADRRTHEAEFEVGKLRYASKPEPLTLWFDAGTFRLTPLPPVIAALEDGAKSRGQLIAECQVRFHLGARKVDEMISDGRRFLAEEQDGHEVIFRLDPDGCADAPWYSLLAAPPGAR